jgi:hypothetical protein
MIRLCLVLWAALLLSACGNYFHDEINAPPLVTVPGTTTPEDPVDPPEGKPTSTSTVFAGVYDGGDTDEAVSVVTTTDGGYLVAGNTRSYGAGGKDIILLRLDQYGNMLWQKTLGGAKDDTVRSMIKTGGGYVILGETTSFGKGDVDLWVIKLNANGNIEWEKTYGGASTERAGGIIEGDNGCLIIGASTRSYGNGNYDMWFIQLSSLGELEYELNEGDTSNDFVEGVFKNHEDNFLFYGYSDIDLPGFYKGILYETDKGFGLNIGAAIKAGSDQIIRALWQAPDEGYIAVIETNAFSAYSSSILVAKFDYRMWSIEWQKYITGNGNSYGKITISGDNESFVIGGSTRAYGAGDYDFFIIEMNYSGTVLKQKTIGSTGTDFLQGMCRNGKGGYLLAGYTTSFGITSPGLFLTSFDGNNGIEGSLLTITDTNATTFNSTARDESFEYRWYDNTYYVDTFNTNAVVKTGEMQQRFY